MIEEALAKEDTIAALIKRAFEEDVRTGDVTTNAILDESREAQAAWIAKDKGIVAGLDIAQQVFQTLDPHLKWQVSVSDGDNIKVRTELLTMKGKARAILTAERIALNIVQRMSGIATMTNKYVQAVKHFPTKILDTRKTVPGLRLLDKYAVAAGGGTNHRLGLFDLAMIKDNHIVAAGSIAAAVQKVKVHNPNIRIEVETTSIDQVEQALLVGADIIMLDNMNYKQMTKAVEVVDDRAQTEASGNITLDTVKKVAQTGVDFISVGALTHSVKAFDISQQLQKIY